MAIKLDYENQLTLLGRWYMQQDTDNAALFEKEIFTECKGLYRAITGGLAWEQIPDKAKAEIIPEEGLTALATLMKHGTEALYYSQAKAAALTAQRAIYIDKLNTAKESDRQRLYDMIDDISDIIAGKDRTPIEKHSAKNHLAALMESPTGSGIETGFRYFDKELDGGLYPGLYVLGAISSMGKTALMVQIADQIAEAGNHVLYFTLEMGAQELIARSLSRQTYIESDKRASDSLTSRSISSRTIKNNFQQLNLAKALDHYADKIAPNIWYFESLGDIGTKDIRREVEKHRMATGKTPVIFIDYLQILKPYNEYWTEKRNTDKAITELKKLSRDYNTVVFCISSLNRGSYTGDIDMAAFKESGAIEYGSDVLMALQTPGLEDGETPKDRKKNKQLNDNNKNRAVRELEIKISKNRSGATGGRIRLQNNAMFGYFTDEVETNGRRRNSYGDDIF